MEWKRLRVDGPPPCDGETIFIGVNDAGFCGCFNQHGIMSLANGPMSICFYDTAEGSHEVMSCLDLWAVLDVPNVEVQWSGAGLPAERPLQRPVGRLGGDTPCE